MTSPLLDAVDRFGDASVQDFQFVGARRPIRGRREQWMSEADPIPVQLEHLCGCQLADGHLQISSERAFELRNARVVERGRCKGNLARIG